MEGVADPAGVGMIIGPGGDFGIVAKNPDNLCVKWYNKEVEYLQVIQSSCLDLAKQYMELYNRTYQIQTRLRLPAIILSSFTGIASFGQGTFPVNYQRPVSITVGIINISIAILQTYESYLKIGDIVSKSLLAATSLKKLADRIHCETFVPVDDREKSGIDYLREIFTVYQTILDQAPPLRQNEAITNDEKVTQIREKITSEFMRKSQYIPHPGSVSVPVPSGQMFATARTPQPLPDATTRRIEV